MGSAGRLAVVGGSARHEDDLSVEILESKLYRPAIRPGVVPRPALLTRLRAARSIPTVAVVAPAGYGKTTLLGLWAQDDDRPFAWLSLDEHDNDPIVLLTHLSVPLDRISPLPPETFDALRSPEVSVPATLVPRLGVALSQMPQPVVLVLDDVHHLRDGASLDALVALVGHVRGTTQIVLAGRAMPMPLARQRAQGRALDFGVEDLAFTEEGARALLRAAGADLPDAEVADLARRTEGWAAGLYLAALARTGLRLASIAAAPDQDDRFVSEYLQSELLSGLSPRDRSFLTRTSVLDRLSGPLCDAVLEESGSTAQLDRLQRNNLFLVPLDRQGGWYRYHPLFRGLLRKRLDGAGPEPGRELLRRAADWCEADGRLETALQYAQDAEDVDRVARIAVTLAQPLCASGRSTTVMSWFEWVDARGGRPASVDRRARCVHLRSHGPARRRRPLGRRRRAPVRRVGDEHRRRPFRDVADDRPGCHVPTRCGTDSFRRRRRSPCPARSRVRRGHGLLVPTVPQRRRESPPGRSGHGGDAVHRRHRTHRRGEACTVLLRDPGLPRRDRTRPRPLERRGEPRGQGHVGGTSQAYRVPRHQRARVRPRCPAGAPPRGSGTRTGPARGGSAPASTALPCRAVVRGRDPAGDGGGALGLGDPGAARQFVRDAEGVLRRRADVGSLGKRTDELRCRLAAREATDSENSTLTSAELRILPLLVTYLSLAGIADRLCLSRHTVKSQVWSMYRKLQVHTRGDAVARARELGLLDV
jgi:LuxR family transcriptional regulator, maltose regulon positive regulatory protein